MLSLEAALATKATLFPLFVCLFACFGTKFTQPTLNQEKTIFRGTLDRGFGGGIEGVPKGTKMLSRAT